MGKKIIMRHPDLVAVDMVNIRNFTIILNNLQIRQDSGVILCEEECLLLIEASRLLTSIAKTYRLLQEHNNLDIEGELDGPTVGTN